MKDYIELPDGRKVYSLDGIRSRQTGTNAETCIIIGARNIGKTFNVRLLCLQEFLKDDSRFVEISRSETEMEAVAAEYTDKIASENVLPGYIFKTDRRHCYIAKECPEDAQPEWKLCGYFVALTTFQRQKRRAGYVDVRNAIFDEFAIDKRSVYTRYLPGEYGIFADVLNSAMRPFPNDGIKRHVYLLGNSCDLTCPYLRNLGITKIPRYGYTFFKNKTVLLHYVEPWDADERRLHTIIGRMLEGEPDAAMVFDNEFSNGSDLYIEQKSDSARYAFGLVFNGARFAIWSDLRGAMFYVTGKIPNNAENVYSLTKKDSNIDYTMLQRCDSLLKMLVKMFYAQGLRYDSPATRECFFEVLEFLGIK